MPEGEEARFTALLEALADGTPIDWAAAEATAASEDDRAVIRRLSRIGLVATFQRGSAAPGGAAMWSHLQLLEKIGEGAFGDVYRAHDPRLARDVALKLLHQPVSDDGRRASAVIEEGRLLARVRHPNVVTVYGAESLNGQVGIWTEFIEGQTLHAIVTEHGPLPIADVVSIALDLCRALAAVHDAGLLHRDIKAQNVMRETGGRIVLMDFGTGRELDSVPGRPGDLSGTPLYMAPELFDGAEASIAADIYALGVLLFFLLTGHYPVAGPALRDVRTGHREHRSKSLADFRKDVPDGLRDAIERALETDPAARHETAHSLGRALTPATADYADTGVGVPVRPMRFKVALIIASLAGATLLVLGWIATGQWRRGSDIGRQPGIGVVNQQIWTGQNVRTEGTASPDGRYLSAVGEDGNLVLHDFESGEDRRLTNADTKKFAQFAEESAISRDGGQVAYAWRDEGKGRTELRVIALGAPVPLGSRTLVDDGDVEWIAPYDWSPDGHWIAASLARRDRSVHIGLLSTSDGTWRELKQVDWRGTSKMAFSSDGRLVAFDESVGDAFQRDVFLVDERTLQIVPAVANPANDTLVGWAPNGTSLLFASDRSGAIGVWALPIAKGAPAGEAKLIKSDLGSRAYSISVTGAGTLVYGVQASSTNVYVAEVDFESGKMVAPPTEAVESYLLQNVGPDWSADGSQLVFISARPKNMSAITLLSMNRNEPMRQWRPDLENFNLPRWAPDGSITVQGTDFQERQGIYRVDARTGKVSPLLRCKPGVKCVPASWTPNGEELVFLRQSPAGWAAAILNVKSQVESTLVSFPGTHSVDGVRLSPNGSLMTYIHHDRATRQSTLYVRSLRGGPSREIVNVKSPEGLADLAEWTPDGHHLVFARKVNHDGRDELTLWSSPLDGGPAVELKNLHPRQGPNMLRIHPLDGRHVAFGLDGERGSLEVWALTNFLPVAALKK